MWRFRMPALAAGRDRMGANAFAEFDDRNEAVAVIAEDVPCDLGDAHLDRCERAVSSWSEGHRNARRIIAEMRGNRGRDALDAVDLAPRHLPPPEVARELADCREERPQLLSCAGVAADPVHVQIPIFARRWLQHPDQF